MYEGNDQALSFFNRHRSAGYCVSGTDGQGSGAYEGIGCAYVKAWVRGGQAAAVLGREREKWYHEFFGEKAFEVGEWAFLVSGFEGIEGNNG